MGTHYKGAEDDELTLNAFIKLMRATNSLNNRLRQHLGEVDLTMSQFGVLETVYHLGPLNQKTLGKKLLKSAGNITLVIDNLEKCSLVKRQCDPSDRRAMLIHLTDEGETFIDSFFPKHLSYIRSEFEVLSAAEKKQLANICKKLGLSE